MRLSLTEVGKIYYERCKATLADVEEADAYPSSTSSEPRCRLRVNALMSFGIACLGPAVAGYCPDHPNVQVEMELNDRLVDVIGEGFDVSIRIAGLQDSSLIARKIAACRLVLCAAQASGPPRASKRPSGPGHPSVSGYTNAPAADTWTLYGSEGRKTVRVSGPVSANNGDLLRAAAIEGLVIGCLPSFLVGDDLRSGRLEALLTGFALVEIGVFALFPSHRYLSAKVRTFVDSLVAYSSVRRVGEQTVRTA